MWRGVLCAILSGLLAASCVTPTVGHSGGTDEDGCHENTTTGDFHCHDRSPSGSSGESFDPGLFIGLTAATAVLAGLVVWAATASAEKKAANTQSGDYYQPNEPDDEAPSDQTEADSTEDETAPGACDDVSDCRGDMICYEGLCTHPVED